ncbi:MAG TPA: hypothetical protein VJI67_01810, partial [archaeon]|nr:hypothetical protein [archaeon]
MRPDGRVVPYKLKFDKKTKSAELELEGLPVKKFVFVDAKPSKLKKSPFAKKVKIEETGEMVDQNVLGLDLLEEEKWLEAQSQIVVPDSSVVQAFVINLDWLEFQQASFSFVSSGQIVWKCKNWNFTARACSDGNWVKWIDTSPNQEYTLELSAGDPGIAVSSRTTGIVAYYENNAANTNYPARYRNWTGTGWSAEGNATYFTSSNDIEWIRVACSPTERTCIAAWLDSGGIVYAEAWKNNAWQGQKIVAPNIGTTNDQSQGFDIAFEQSRGWGLVVSANNSANPYWAIWYPENNTWSG